MKIKICVPYYHEEQFEEAKPFLNRLLACKEHEFVVASGQGTDIGRTRNWLVNGHVTNKKFQKIEGDFDYILDVDCDIQYTLEDVLAMIAHDKDIVGLPYLRQGDPNEKQYEVHKFHGDIPGSVVGWYDTSDKGLQPVDSQGCGLLLKKVKVHEAMEYLWYRKAQRH